MTGNTTWRTSSYSGGSGGDCVEVRDDTGRVLVRDTKDRTGPVLPFTPQAWQRFADRVKRPLAGPQTKHPPAPSLEGARSAHTEPFLVSSRGAACVPCHPRATPRASHGHMRWVLLALPQSFAR